MTPRTRDPYDQPSDPWTDPGRWDGGAGQQHGYGDQSVGYGEAYQAEPAAYGTIYGQARVGEVAYPAPPRRSSTKLIATVVAVLAVLAGGGVTAYLLTDPGEQPAAAPTARAADQGGAADGGTEATAPATEPTATPAPESSAEARFVSAGQCLVNDGTDAQPRMRIVGCGLGTYQVLARFDGTTDYTAECAKVKGYQFHYFFDSELDALDFVLCLKER